MNLKHPDNTKEKTKHFPLCPENKKNKPDEYNDYMKKIKPKNYTTPKKLLCDWTDKNNYLIHYRMLKIHVRHGMIVEKILEIISFKQSKWLQNFINFNTQKRNRAKNDFERDFFQLLVNAALGKMMEKIRNRLKKNLLENMIVKKLLINNRN